eukprot:6096814-Prymnesium_polylepis.1
MATDSKPEPIVSGKSYDATVLAPEDAWMANLEYEAFKEDIRALGKELHANQGPADLAHLNKIILWSRMSMVVGFGERTRARPRRDLSPAQRRDDASGSHTTHREPGMPAQRPC